MAERGLPSLWRVVLVALVVVAIAEIGVRVRAGLIEEPFEWYSRVVQSSVAEAELVRSVGIVSDILFVGTSMVRRDVQVEIIEDRLDEVNQAHNAALPAAQTPVVHRWLLEELVPRLEPTRVVWGVSSLDFNGNRLESTIDLYESARATRPGWVGSLDRGLGDLMALSHHRVALRNPVLLGLLIGLGDHPAEPESEQPEPIDPDSLMVLRNRWR